MSNDGQGSEEPPRSVNPRQGGIPQADANISPSGDADVDLWCALRVGYERAAEPYRPRLRMEFARLMVKLEKRMGWA